MADDVRDLGSPMYGGDEDPSGGPSDGPHFERLKAIQEGSPSQRDMHGSAPDGTVDGYSEARWAGHDLTPAPATAGGNAVAYRLMSTAGLETYDPEVAEAGPLDAVTAVGEAEEGRYLPDGDIAPDAAVPVVSRDDPSGPEGGDFSKDPQATVNYWGVVSADERDDEGRVSEVRGEPLEQDKPADLVEAPDEGDEPVYEASDDEGVSADDATRADVFDNLDEATEHPQSAPTGASDGHVSYGDAPTAPHGGGDEDDEPRSDGDIVDESDPDNPLA